MVPFVLLGLFQLAAADHALHGYPQQGAAQLQPEPVYNQYPDQTNYYDPATFGDEVSANEIAGNELYSGNFQYAEKQDIDLGFGIGIGLNALIAVGGLLVGAFVVNEAQMGRDVIKKRAGTIKKNLTTVSGKLPALKKNNAKQCGFLSALGTSSLVFAPPIGGQDKDDVGTVIGRIESTLNFILQSAKDNTCA